MSQAISIVIAEDSASIRSAIQTILKNSGHFEIRGIADDGQAALTLCKEHQPDVVLLDVEMPKLNGIQAAKQISTLSPGSIVVMLSSSGSMDIVRESLRAGAKDFIAKPISAGVLVTTLLAIFNREKGKRRTVTEGSRRKIIAVTGARDGMGSTTLAANCAAAMAHATKGKIAAVDLDFRFADLSHCLGVSQQQSIADLCSGDIAPSAEAVAKVLVETPSNVRVMPGPASPGHPAPRIALLEGILSQLAGDHDAVFIDLPPGSSDLWSAVMDISERILFVVASDLSAIRSAKLCLESLARKPVSRRIQVVYNHVTATECAGRSEVQEFISHPIFAEVGCDPDPVTRAYLARAPFALQPDSRIGHDVRRLVQALSPAGE